MGRHEAPKSRGGGILEMFSEMRLSRHLIGTLTPPHPDPHTRVANNAFLFAL